MTDTITPPQAAETTAAATGIRVATAVIGGSIAVLAIVVAAIGQFGIAGAATVETSTPIPASVTSIEIDNAIGDVSVFTTPGATPSVDIRVDSTALNRASGPTVEIEGNELTVYAPDRDGPCFFACLGSITVLVELGDLELTELDISSDVGNISVHEAVVAGELSIESSVGDIRIDQVGASTIDVTTDVGSVQVWAAETTRSITVTSSVGDIEVGVLPGVEYDVWASSEVGSVTTDLAESRSAPRTITVSSEVGDVTVFTIR